MAAKKAKLNDQFLEKRPSTEGPASNIFRGVIIHVDGYTSKSRLALNLHKSCSIQITSSLF